MFWLSGKVGCFGQFMNFVDAYDCFDYLKEKTE
jgi:hypothetical protein